MSVYSADIEYHAEKAERRRYRLLHWLQAVSLPPGRLSFPPAPQRTMLRMELEHEEEKEPGTDFLVVVGD